MKYDNRFVLDFCMRNEDKLKQAISLELQDRAHIGCGAKVAIKKPTEQQAILNLTPISSVLIDNFVLVRYPQKILSCIRYTKAHFNNRPEGEFYKLYYIEHKEREYICEKLGFEKSTFYNRKCDVLDYAEKVWSDLKCDWMRR